MRKKHIFILVGMIILSMFTVGCGEKNIAVSWKNSLINGFNDWMQSFSKYALTNDFELQGIRKYGIDNYTGSYEATYFQWTGKELLFGGTSLQRENGNQLKVTYTLTIAEGTARLYRLAAGQEYPIADTNAANVIEFTIDSGDNYIILEGNQLSGSLSLNVE